MKGSSFITIGLKDTEDNDCVRLSDLKVTGIPESGCWNSVKIIYLNKDGSNRLYEEGPLSGTEMKFQWTDDGHDGEWGGAPGWYGVDGLPMDGTSAAGLASEVQFSLGQGIYFEVDVGFENCQLLCNGQVVTGQVEFRFNSDANVFVSNPLARTITRSLTVATPRPSPTAVGMPPSRSRPLVSSCSSALRVSPCVAVVRNDLMLTR